jgi:hypothetical protein
VYPKFVVNWIKDTSPTGFLRKPTNINKRNQDGPKENWFCNDCEQLLSKDEKQFAEKVFSPYVNALDNHEYSDLFKDQLNGEFILRFAIGLQLRAILANTKIDQLNIENIELINKFRDHWKKYLLENESKTGDCETHIFFFTSFEGATGQVGDFEFASNINTYLTRAMDSTIIDSASGKILGVYCKIGPIAFITSIKPRKLKGLVNTKISLKKNKLSCVQKYMNPTIVNFLWKDRPNQIIENSQELSEKQKEKVDEAYLKDPEKSINSLGHRMNTLDEKS